MIEKMRTGLADLCKKYDNIKISFSYQTWETDFLRFYQNQINYNIQRENVNIHVSIYKDKKPYSFAMSNPDLVKVEEKIFESLEIIDSLPEDNDFVDLEKDTRIAKEHLVVNNVENVTLTQKIEILQKISEAVKKYNFEIYGTFIVNNVTNYIINSNGLNKVETYSPIMLEVKAVSKENQVTVLESFGSVSLEKLDVDKFIESLVRKVQTAKFGVVDLPANHYEVILAPRCIGEYLSYLTYGMTAGSLDQKESFFEGKINKKIFPENITLTDNPSDPDLIPFKYDGNGHLYQKTELIKNGVFKNFMVDNYYSYKTGLEENGANGSCLVMDEGDKDLAEMISGVKHGIYISSLHYMNFINPKETSLTGLTRDGTFLIENGELKNVVNNLRFTVKISDILNNITEIENKSSIVPFSENYGEFDISLIKMPHVKVNNFNITSSTKTI